VSLRAPIRRATVTNQKLLAVSAACLLSLGAASINAWAAELGDLLVTGWLRTVVAWSAWSPAPKGFAASSSGSLARQAIRCRQPSPDDRNADWSSSPAPTPVRRGTAEGRITDPRDGRTYRAQLWREPANRLHLWGYIGVPLLGVTQVRLPFIGHISTECRFV